MNRDPQRGTTLPTEAPGGHEEPEPSPGEPSGPSTAAQPGREGRRDEAAVRRGHIRYGIGVLILLFVLGWLTFDIHPDPVLLLYVAVLAGLYRYVATLETLSRRARENLVFAILSVGLIGLLGVLSGWSTTYLVFILTTIVIWATFALGLNLEFGYTGIINFGHVAFMGIGAYSMAILSTSFIGPDTSAWNAALLVFGAALVGVVLAGLAGVVLGLPSLRLRADYLAIVTIGAAEILRRVFRNEREITGGPTGITELPRPFPVVGPEWGEGVADFLFMVTDLLDVRNPNRLVILILAVVVLLVVVGLFTLLLRSPYGRVLRAIREDEEVARALGKNVFLYKLQVLAMGSMVAALAGSLLAWHRLFISPETFIPLFTFYAWIIIVLGGVGNNKGTILGAIILWTFFEATRSLNLDTNLGLSGPQGGALRIVIIGVLLVLLMLFKPEGILGRREEMVLGD